MMKLQIPEASVEYVTAPIISEDVIDGAWPVDMAIIPEGQRSPQVADWQVAAWEADSIRLLIGPGTALPLTCGDYTVWVRIGASPESAVRRAGQLEVV